MCFGGKKSAAPAPAPAPVAEPNPNNVADNSNDVQRKASMVAASGSQPTSFGSELGSSTPSSSGY